MDDVAETLLLNLLWQGRCDGMMPKVSMFGGLVTIIRPFFYIEEKDLTRACRLGSFPVRSCSCQYAMHSHRELAGSLLEQVRRAGVRGVAANLARVTLRHPPNPRES